MDQEQIARLVSRFSLPGFNPRDIGSYVAQNLAEGACLNIGCLETRGTTNVILGVQFGQHLQQVLCDSQESVPSVQR